MFQVVDDGNGLQAPHGRIESLDHTRREVVAVEVAVEALLDIGAQDFDGDGLLDAVVEHVGLVNLCDRRRRDGRTEFDEMIFELTAERAFYRLARFRHREGLGLILKVAEIGGQLGADDVGTGREKLAELYVARPEFRQRGRDARSRAVRFFETAPREP